VAYTEEQSDELAYYALKTILEYSPLADDFDIGIERIMRVNGDGKAVSLASSPDSRDGALTTFQVCDETHHWTTQRLIDAHKTMLANLAKRKMADPWSLETTTAPCPGEGSVAERTMEYANKVAAGKIEDVHLFFFHRFANDTHDLSTPEGVRSAVVEACGPTAGWRDLDAICDQFDDPTTDKSYLRRVWLNQLVQGSEKAFDFQKWEERKSDFVPQLGDTITLGFDGARFRDAVGLVATHYGTGFQWPLGVWEKPEKDDDWEAPQDEIDQIVNGAFTMYNVVRMYCDPQFWESHVAEWAGKYSEKKVIAWHTNRINQMVYAIRGFNNSIMAKELTHNGDAAYSRHIANAIKKKVNIVDDHGEPFILIFKERADSPKKIDLAMAGILSWQARNDALKSGVPESNRSIYETRGMISV
jgi:phage terminase large subunit-like protein